ncbi:glutamate--tRNA ligase [Candidatus Saccharibacteria bacterium]|nr:glutamate--tRNA ligase [Candidatus Saccharibacteria bacterium]
MTTRTRFAPSPTGFLHVGGIRTALFAFLVARQSNGQLVLRLEDTDQKREVPGSKEHLISSLKAIGINYDEGPDIGGPYAPYVQSERLENYKQWAQKLIDSGRAYADPYTPEEVQKFREEAQSNKQAFLYRNYRPTNPPAWNGTQPLRFKAEPKPYSYHDEVMGDITTSPDVVDDIILIKSDGYPTYNFAHIVDDAEMHITHVIRGQEFISSMPNYLAIYEALDLPRPIFAHMPHIMNEQGNKKLGKRDGAKDVLDYIRDGYLAEAMMSFIATMGWNDGTEQEVFTKQELIEKFSLGKVQRSGARFDEKRLLWVNGHFIRELGLNELYERVEFFWSDSAKKSPESYKKQILALAQDRLKTLKDLPALTSYFFEEPAQDYSLIDNNKQLKKLSNNDISDLLNIVKNELEQLELWTPEAIQDCLNILLETTNQKPGTLFSLIRIATTWAQFSPQLSDTLAVLGQQKTLDRLSRAALLL